MITEELLRHELITNGITIKALAEQLGVARHIVSNLVSKYKLSDEIKSAKIQEKIGQEFGKLTIKSYHSTQNKHIKYNCECECGNLIPCFYSSLQSGDSESCGCNTKSRMSNKNWKGHGDISMTHFSRMRHQAKQRGLEFSVTIEDIWQLFVQQGARCALSGQDIKFVRCDRVKGCDKSTASLDRIDNTKGYSIDNVQWLHKDVNIMKLDHTTEDFIRLCGLIFNHAKKI